MPRLGSFGVRIAPPLVLLLLAPSLPAAATALPQASASRPSVLNRFAGFTARIDYAGHRIDRANAPEIEGSATVVSGRFSISERGPNYELNATPDGVTVRSGRLDLHASDPLDADVLVNAWTMAVAALSRGEVVRRSATAWQAAPGIVVYLDEGGSGIAGMSGHDAGRLAFTFSAWSDLGGALFPTRIVRLRNGVTDAIFQIDRLDVVRAGTETGLASTETSTRPFAAFPTRTRESLASSAAPARAFFPWLPVLTAFGSFLLAIGVVAWLRRDAFSTFVCGRLAADPRGWRHASSAAFVDADGALHFEGNTYRVGPKFYARSVEVQLSPLFIRVSAPGISWAVVLPRRLPRPVPRRRMRKAIAAGLSVVETLVGTAFFATVMVGAVFPALTAVARADFVAAQKRAAIIAAVNALTDEEMACAYGVSAPTGTSTQTLDGLTVAITVTASAVAGARDIRVAASDSSGHVLATLATTVGPPVPAPSAPPGSPGGG